MTKTSKSWLLGAGSVVAVLAAAKFLLHLYTGRHYGYFVDELYYLACAQHLDWGYVDQPPLIALMAWLVRSILGTSLSAIHMLPAIAGAGMVLLTGLLARELGGGRFAQGLAALCFLLAPGLLLSDHLFTMNAFEPLLWMGCALLVIRIIRTGETRLWLWFGVLAGVGMENKHSMLMFAFALIAGLMLTRARGILNTRWLWAGGLLAALIFLPNLLWNIQHHFPFLELQENIRRSGRNVDLSPVNFFIQEALAMLPFTLPVWLAGLWYLFYHREGRQFRALGWAWLITAALIVRLNPRIYYLFPAMPLLFAAGSVAWEGWLAAPRWQWVKPVYGAIMVLAAALLAPTVIPLLPPETYIRYSAAMHLQQPRIENFKLGPLPQLFADQFGWEEIAATVAGVYHSLPPEVRAKTCIFGQNYGQAGAIDLFGPQYGLPRAISGHQNYFLWGPHGCTGESVIVLDDREENLAPQYVSVRKAGHVEHPYSMPYEHFDIYYCQGIKRPVNEVWPLVKRWS